MTTKQNIYRILGRSITAKNTVIKINRALSGFIKWLSIEHQVHGPDKLQISHLDSWQQHLLNWRTVKGLPLKPSTMNVRIDSVQGFLALSCFARISTQKDIICFKAG